jgi:3-dehydro-L-gulonate 2-dehydrogenase
MSMFSYGKLESYARSGRELPVEGGYNKEQQLTKNAAEILETHQCTPIGYWKGSGLSLAQDMKTSAPVSADRPVYYPGENMMRTREENMRQGIPVDEAIWGKVLAM